MASSLSNDDVQKVREATDLVALISERVPVKQRGKDFWCCCPFHHEKTPSMKIDPVMQLWHCFGCGEGGDVFSYVMKLHDMTFPEALHDLADRAHIELTDRQGKGVSSSKKQRLHDVCKAAAEFYHNQLMRGSTPGAAKAREYLAGRGFGGQVPKAWELGFAPGNNTLTHHLSSLGFTADEMMQSNVVVQSRNGRTADRFFDRVMFPIKDAQGECIAFGGRVIGEGNPKYLNSNETPIFHKSQVLYGLDKAKSYMTATGTAIVVEGYTDVISLHEAGIKNAVATLGTALTMQHIRILSRHAGKRVVYLFDGDAAGQRAAERALQFIDYSMTPEAGKNKMEICAVTLPGNLDPAEYVAKEGAAALSRLIDSAESLLLYGINRRIAAHDIGTAEGRSAALMDALSILAPIKDSILAKDYAVQIASKVHVREEDALSKLANLQYRKPLDVQEERVPSSGQKNPAGSYHYAISKTEDNRLKFEREFLSLSAQYPVIALQYADRLSKIQWHDSVHDNLASALLSVLFENLDASSPEIIAKVSQLEPKAAGILTSAFLPEGSTPESAMVYLSKELEIGDREEAIKALKAKLAAPELLDNKEGEKLFEDLVKLQQGLAELRKR